jgi:putative ABC transport system permease protein
VVVDPARTTAADLAATRRLPEVTAAAGPFTEVTVVPGQAGPGGGQAAMPPMIMAGRASPGGPVDDLILQSGHWADGPGQLVLASNPSPGSSISVPLGTKITVAAARRRTLTVVGIASSIDSSAGGWVLPGEIAKLRAPGTPE